MISIHFCAFVAYLVSIILRYILSYLWQADDASLLKENEYYVACCLQVTLSFIVQSVLTYIFWSLSKKIKREDVDNKGEQDHLLQNTQTSEQIVFTESTE